MSFEITLESLEQDQTALTLLAGQITEDMREEDRNALLEQIQEAAQALQANCLRYENQEHAKHGMEPGKDPAEYILELTPDQKDKVAAQTGVNLTALRLELKEGEEPTTWPPDQLEKRAMDAADSVKPILESLEALRRTDAEEAKKALEELERDPTLADAISKSVILDEPALQPSLEST